MIVDPLSSSTALHALHCCSCHLTGEAIPFVPQASQALWPSMIYLSVLKRLMTRTHGSRQTRPNSPGIKAYTLWPTKIVVPEDKDLRVDIIRLYHAPIYAGH